jgi:hypothetical protein
LTGQLLTTRISSSDLVTSVLEVCSIGSVIQEGTYTEEVTCFEELEALSGRADVSSGQCFGIRIQKGKNYPQKYKKVKKISCFEVLDVLF